MNIAIIDDQEDIQYAVEKILKKRGHTCYGFYGNEKDLLDAFEVFNIDLIITDMLLEKDLTGLDVLKQIKEHGFDLPTILITAYTTPSNLIEASMCGIVDIIQKPFSTEDILKAVTKYENENENENTSTTQDDEEFIGSFEYMKDIYKNIGIAAKSESTVCIFGETGTGKDLVAKLIHKNSKHSSEPFITINCATIPVNLFERLMYGKIENFSKSKQESHIGYVQKVGKGTLFLDKVGELDPILQVKLLRFIENRSFYTLGDANETKFDGKIICAASKSKKELENSKTFRKDLFYIISTFEITLPNLQNRKNDIKELVQHFIKQNNQQYQLHCADISDDALFLLENYNYKGNIRELKNIIYKAMMTSRRSSILLNDIEKILTNKAETQDSKLNRLCFELVSMYDDKTMEHLFQDIEKEILTILFHKIDNITKLAKMLNMSRNTLKDKLKKYGL